MNLLWMQVHICSTDFRMVLVLLLINCFSVYSSFFPSLSGPFQGHDLQMVSPSLSCSTVFLPFEKIGVCLFNFLLYFKFDCMFCRYGKIHLVTGLFGFFLDKTWFDLFVWIWWSVGISKSKTILCVSFCKMDLVCAFTIFQYGQTLFSCTILRESPFLIGHDDSCTPLSYCNLLPQTNKIKKK